MKNLLLAGLFTIFFSAVTFGQPRPVEKTANPNVKPAPPTFEAKYEGGLFGFAEKIDGTLKIDDANNRLVFLSKEKKEMFSFPFASLLVISPNSNSVTSTTGSVISHIPLPGAGLAGLMREKKRYLVVQFNDEDADVKGVVNFKLDDKALLESVIQTLGTKAKLTQRGDAFYKPRAPRTVT